MRSMERNKQTIYYALYQGKTPILDDDGNETGDSKISYSNPVKFKIRVSPNKGDSSEEVFGKSLDYDRVMYTAEHSFPIDEYSILWINEKPEIKEDGSTDTSHDYTVTRLAKDLNEWLFAIKKVK